MIEHKEPISLVEAKIAQGEDEARGLLRMLEQAMVRCGYTRDGIYNSRYAKFSGKRERPTIIFWTDGQILLGVGEKLGTLSVDEMNADKLIHTAFHLASFLDALEGGSRHLITQIRNACASIQAVIDSTNAQPRPSSNPARMPVE